MLLDGYGAGSDALIHSQRILRLVIRPPFHRYVEGFVSFCPLIVYDKNRNAELVLVMGDKSHRIPPVALHVRFTEKEADLPSAAKIRAGASDPMARRKVPIVSVKWYVHVLLLSTAQFGTEFQVSDIAVWLFWDRQWLLSL